MKRNYGDELLAEVAPSGILWDIGFRASDLAVFSLLWLFDAWSQPARPCYGGGTASSSPIAIVSFCVCPATLAPVRVYCCCGAEQLGESLIRQELLFLRSQGAGAWWRGHVPPARSFLAGGVRLPWWWSSCLLGPRGVVSLRKNGRRGAGSAVHSWPNFYGDGSLVTVAGWTPRVKILRSSPLGHWGKLFTDCPSQGFV